MIEKLFKLLQTMTMPRCTNPVPISVHAVKSFDTDVYQIVLPHNVMKTMDKLTGKARLRTDAVRKSLFGTVPGKCDLLLADYCALSTSLS